jgi:hypothetical protein
MSRFEILCAMSLIVSMFALSLSIYNVFIYPTSSNKRPSTVLEPNLEISNISIYEHYVYVVIKNNGTTEVLDTDARFSVYTRSDVRVFQQWIARIRNSVGPVDYSVTIYAPFGSAEMRSWTGDDQSQVRIVVHLINAGVYVTEANFKADYPYTAAETYDPYS